MTPLQTALRSATLAALVVTIVTPLGIAKPAPLAEVNDLPVPYNVQAVTLKQAITLTWQWQSPEQKPNFLEFGFEVRRQDGRSTIVPELTYVDQGLPFGSYTYRVRTHGLIKENGKRVTHVSDWSEPVSGTIKVTCTGAPTIELRVQPIQRAAINGGAPSLRLHLAGQAQVPEGCNLSKVSYHIDSGTGIMHNGLVKTKPDGRFDEFVDALGPEDEVPSGTALFSITATAEDEAGPTTSDAFTVQLRQQGRYEPRSNAY